MTEIILGIILSILTVLLNFSFLKSIYKKDVAEDWRDYSWIVFWIIIYVVASVTLSEIPLIKVLVIIAISIFTTYRIFKVPVKKCVLSNLLFSGIYVSTELVVALILEKIIMKNSLSDVTNSNGAFIAELICQLTIFLLIITLNLVFKKTLLSEMDLRGWIIFSAFPLFTLITIIILITSTENLQMGQMFNKMIFLAAGMLTLNILLFILIDNVIKRETDIREKKLLIEQTEHINDMYRSLSTEREKQKSRSHDYLNHMNIMLMLAKDRKYDEQIKYIEEQIGKENENVDIIDTGNALINAVLNIKYSEAKKNGIVIPFIADNLSDISISDSDLVTILTNILDNAIEAVQKCDDKRIVFKILKDNNTLYIDSSNTYIGQILDVDHHKTTKNNPEEHGYGIANIKKIVKSNNGNCYIETQNGMFHITVSIPLT